MIFICLFLYKRQERKEKYIMKKVTKNTKINGENLQYKNQGITLIALVITIIVLLILARYYNSDINRRKSEY